MNDTIFAPATAPGRAAVAIIRISGPGAGNLLLGLTTTLPAPRQASLRALRHPIDGALIDRALTIWMPGPTTFTGEDCAELHLHGGIALVERASDALRRLGGRFAEPGEFTRRAFEHGRLDLTQAEAVADLVDAQTQAQLRQGLAQLDGALSGAYAGWADTLLNALARLEAILDFPDEEIEADLLEVHGTVRALAAEIGGGLGSRRGEQIRNGFRVALIGSPNAGKSSLMNALAGRDVAIVTDLPGTTRDVLEVSLVLQGYTVVLSDTAGLRLTEDRIEAEGVRRARAAADRADLPLHVIDASTAGDDAPPFQADPNALIVLSKTDLAPDGGEGAARRWAERGWRVCRTSAIAGDVAALRQAIEGAVIGGADAEAFPAVTQARHRECLEDVTAALGRIDEQGAPELVVEDIRLALRSLERLVGRSNPDAVLDRVFAAFCIGK